MKGLHLQLTKKRGQAPLIPENLQIFLSQLKRKLKALDDALQLQIIRFINQNPSLKPLQGFLQILKALFPADVLPLKIS